MKRAYDKFVSVIVSMMQSVEDLVHSTRADKLVFAAFVVAILRQMGVNGHFIGYDPATEWPWFQPAEVLSGIAMALLIGVALAYIARRWRRVQPAEWVDWVYWTFILAGMLIILVFEIFYVSIYAYAAQRGSLVHIEFSPFVNMVWNVTVAGVLPLMAILVGIVSDDDYDSKSQIQEEVFVKHGIGDRDEAWLVLVAMVKSGHKRIMPDQLARQANVSVDTAGQVIREAHDMGMLN